MSNDTLVEFLLLGTFCVGKCVNFNDEIKRVFKIISIAIISK